MRMTAPYDDTEIAHAAEMLRAGRLVAFPTETVYGLGADATSTAALQRLYAVKGRPPSHPVIVHVGRASQLDDIAIEVPGAARALATACWPGPLSLVVRRRPGAVAGEATGGRDTVGVRVPNHPLALALLDAFGGPVAAPSANRFGRVSPTTAAHVRADLGHDVDAVLDGGPCAVGVESTIVDVTGAAPVVLRVGGVSESRVGEIVGASVARVTDGSVAAPGTLAAHYSPIAPVEVVAAVDLEKRAAMLRASGKWVQILNTPPDTAEYARVLYASLREADQDGVDVILAVAPPDDGGMGTVVRDRLRRAAAQ
jgi:L-threonylcarbamoyladenylate synthase